MFYLHVISNAHMSPQKKHKKILAATMPEVNNASTIISITNNTLH
jgi:hypothetical protein